MLLNKSFKNLFETLCSFTTFRFAFRFENDRRAVLVYEDQSIAEAMSILWETRICTVAVVQRETERVIGCVRTSDVYHLLDNEHLFNNRK